MKAARDASILLVILMLALSVRVNVRANPAVGVVPEARAAASDEVLPALDFDGTVPAAQLPVPAFLEGAPDRGRRLALVVRVKTVESEGLAAAETATEAKRAAERIACRIASLREAS